MNSVPKLFSCSYADCWTKNHFFNRIWRINAESYPFTRFYGGAFQGGSGERLHGMQEVSGSIPLFSTKKALYFVGSMVLFFLLKPIFWGCIASPAPFSGFCRRFLYNPQRLTLHHFQKGLFAARFFSRLLHRPLQCTA